METTLDLKKQGLYAFVERVAQVYHAIRTASDPARGMDMHLDRVEKTREAITIALRKFALAGLTDVDVATTTLLPALEVIFRMPAKGSPRGSKEWIRRQLRELQHVTFKDLCEFPQLMRAHCKREVSTRTRPNKKPNPNLYTWKQWHPMLD